MSVLFSWVREDDCSPPVDERLSQLYDEGMSVNRRSGMASSAGSEEVELDDLSSRGRR
jgi:hypothetical protein